MIDIIENLFGGYFIGVNEIFGFFGMDLFEN